MTFLPHSKVLIILSTLVPGFLRVVIERETFQEKRVAWDCIVRGRDLRLFVEQEKPTAIWHDDERVELCYTPGCNNLVRADDPCDLCPACLLEYRAEQISYLNDAAWLARFKAARQAADAAYEAVVGEGVRAQAVAYQKTFSATMEASNVISR